MGLALLECLMTPISKLATFETASKVVGKNIQDNSEYYADFCRFNFANSVSKKKRYEILNYADLPPEVASQINKIKKKLGYDDLDYDEQLELLKLKGCRVEIHNLLEAKYCYLYEKRFKTLKYSSDRKITEEELLKSVNKKQFEQFV